jgi:hypothetical protein
MMMLESMLPLATAPAGNRSQGGMAQHETQNFSWPTSCKTLLWFTLPSELDHKRALQSRDALMRPPVWVDATHLT